MAFDTDSGRIRGNRIIYIVVGALLFWAGWTTHVPPSSDSSWVGKYYTGLAEGCGGVVLMVYGFLTLFRRKGDDDNWQESEPKADDSRNEREDGDRRD